MARIARVVVEGIAHHVTQRGNFRASVFDSDEDRQYYISLLGEYAKRYGLEIYAWCLMNNHVHLIVVPHQAESLSLALGRTHMRYAQQINHNRGQSGHLWQNRFFSCPLDAVHTYLALRYVECNPVRAGLVSEPWDYRWSSAKGHIDGKGDELVKTQPKGIIIDGWREFLSEPEDEKVNILRQATQTGRPIGTEIFLQNIEDLVGRSLKLGKSGRPRIQKER